MQTVHSDNYIKLRVSSRKLFRFVCFCHVYNEDTRTLSLSFREHHMTWRRVLAATAKRQESLQIRLVIPLTKSNLPSPPFVQ